MNEIETGTPPALPTPEAPKPPAPPLESNASINAIFDSLLKYPHSLINSIRQNENPRSLISKLLLLVFTGLLVFGIILGSFSPPTQLWAAPLKTIVGILFSAMICLPSLYIFAALTGTSLRFIEVVQGLAATLALIGALLLGFTPVLWVFSQSTDSVAFFGSLAVLAWFLSVILGSGFLIKMLRHTGTQNTAPVRIWIAIFLLVTFQMSTSLRPIIGSSDKFLTTEKRFFLEHWLNNSTPDRSAYSEGR